MANIESNPGPGTRSNPTDSVLNDISEKLSKMNEKMDRLCNDVSNIRAWQTHVDQKMESLNHENKQLNEAVGSLVDQNERLLRDNKEMANKLVDYEARSRRNNLIFRGIKKETDKESWEQSENLVREILRDKLEMDSGKIEINRAHRLGGNAIIVNFLKYKDREQIMKNKKKLDGTQVYITEDHPYEIRQRRKKLMELTEGCRNEGKSVFLRYDKVVINGRVYKLSDDGDKLVSIKNNAASNTPGTSSGNSD